MSDPPKAPTVKASWRRRVGRALLVLVVLVVVSRVALALALPWLLGRVARLAGLDATVEQATLRILDGSLTLRGVVVREPSAVKGERGAELASLEFLQAHVALEDLWHGRLHLLRADVDGLRGRFVRDASGRWNWPFFHPPADSESVTPVKLPADEGFSLEDFDSFLTIDEVRIRNVRVRYDDAALTPPVSVDAWLDLSAEGYSVPYYFQSASLVAGGEGTLDAMHVESSFTGWREGGEPTYGGFARVKVLGFAPERLRGLLGPLGIEPQATSLSAAADVRLSAQLDARRRASSAVGEIPGAAWLVKVQAKDTWVDADGERRAALDSLRASFSWVPGRRLSDLDASVLRAVVEAVRRRDGSVNTLGLAFQSPSGPERPRAAVHESEPFHVELNTVEAAECEFRFLDESQDEPMHLTYLLDSIVAKDLTTDPDSQRTAGSIRLTARVPEIVETLHAEARLTARRAGMDGRVDLDWKGIRLERLRPLLRAAGVACAFDSCELAAHVEGSFRVPSGSVPEFDCRVRQLEVRESNGDPDPGRLLLEVRGAIENARLGGEALKADRISISRLRVPVTFDDSGGVGVGGLTIGSPAESRPASRPASPSTERSAGAFVLDVRTAEFSDVQSDVEFPMDGARRRTAVRLTDGSIRNLRIGGREATETEVSLTLAVDGIVSGVSLAARIRTRPVPLGFDAGGVVKVRGARADFWGPHLAALGLHPRFEAAELDASFTAGFGDRDGVPWIDFAAADLDIRGGGVPLVTVRQARVEGIRFEGDAIRAESIELDGARAKVERDDGGRIVCAGVELLEASPSLESRPSNRAAGGGPQAAPPRDDGGNRVEIARVRLSDAAVHLTDRSTQGGIDTSVKLDASADGVAAGLGCKEFPARVRIEAERALRAVTLDLEACLDPARLRVGAAVDVQGASGAALAPYLPGSLRPAFESGRLVGRLDASLERKDDGTSAAALAVRDFEWGEEGAPPVLRFEALRARAPKLDTRQRSYTVDEIAFEGVEIRTRRRTDGEIEFGALTVGVLAEAPDASPNAAVPGGSGRPQRPTFPEVIIHKLGVDVRSLEFRDDARPGSEPVRGAMTLTNLESIEMGMGHEDSGAGRRLRLSARVDGLVDELDVLLTGSLLALQPEFDLEFDARGIRGNEIARRFELPWTADDVPDGELQGKLELSIETRRVDPFDFGLVRPFSFSIALEDVSFRGTPAGRLLASLESFHVDAQRVDPANRVVRLKQVEVTRPSLYLTFDDAGLHVLGHVIPPPEIELDTRPKDPAAGDPGAAAGGATESRAGMLGEWDVSASEISVSGLELDFRDLRSDPPLLVPISSLDAVVRRFSTRAFREAIPVTFSASMDAGLVEVPKRHRASSLLAGIATGAVKLATLQGDRAETESRPFLENLTVKGKLTLNGAPRGEVDASLAGLELASVRGLARQSGVQLTDGVLDTRVNVAFRGEAGVDVDTRNTFTYLKVTEGSGGPISTYLKLPAPLDTVLFVLRDENDQQRINFGFHLGATGVSAGAIAAEAASALGSALARAMASAPARLFAMVKGAVPLDLNVKSENLPTGRVPFSPADWLATDADWRGIGHFVDEVRSDPELRVVLQHEFAAADVATIRELANPGARQCMEVVQGLRERRAELVRDRDELEARVRTSLALGQMAAAEDALAGLRAVERIAGEVESSLDQVIDLLRPRAAGAVQRRTRLSSTALAQLRIAKVRTELVARGIDAARIESRPPRAEVSEGIERSCVNLTARRQR